MKRTYLTVWVILLTSVLSYSQSRRSRYDVEACPKLYIGLSSGLENQSGIIGFNMDVPLSGAFSLGAGAGLSSWGYKAYGEGRFYFGKCNKGWALGTGATYNTGLSNFTTTMPTNYGDQQVTMNLDPSTNVFLAAYRFFKMGRSGHRFYLELGYSYRLNDNIYNVLSYHTLTSEGQSAMNILKPGGLIFAFGFSFGVLK